MDNKLNVFDMMEETDTEMDDLFQSDKKEETKPEVDVASAELNASGAIPVEEASKEISKPKDEAWSPNASLTADMPELQQSVLQHILGVRMVSRERQRDQIQPSTVPLRRPGEGEGVPVRPVPAPRLRVEDPKVHALPVLPVAGEKGVVCPLRVDPQIPRSRMYPGRVSRARSAARIRQHRAAHRA